MVNHPPSLDDPYIPAMSATPQVNYVITCPMRSTPHVREYLPSPDLESIFDMVMYSIGLLEPYLPTLIEVVDMYFL
jgi:hypothetical protein